MLEILKRKKVDKQDKQMPQSIEQLIEHYDLEKLWPYIEKITGFVNNQETNITQANKEIEETQKDIPAVVNSLESNSKTDALAAEQGKVLKEKIEGTVLYEKEAGINTGSFTIDNWKTCKRIAFYDINGFFLGEVLPEATTVPLNKIDQGSNNLYMYNARLNISGNDFTFYSNYRNYFNGTAWIRDTSGLVTIGKAIGYK